MKSQLKTKKGVRRVKGWIVLSPDGNWQFAYKGDKNPLTYGVSKPCTITYTP